MIRMIRLMSVPLPLLAGGLVLLASATARADTTPREVVRELNQTASVKASDSLKSYPVVFKAYLEMSPPPMPIGPDFNQGTIHPGMDDWAKVAGWAESNAAMADAIRACEEKILFGLPYGTATLESEFRNAGLVAEIGSDGDLRDQDFGYQRALAAIAAFATAEAYRLGEAGKPDDGLELLTANIFLLRQCCDREFLEEQFRAIEALTVALDNLRDMFYVYRTTISPGQFARIAKAKLPFLRPDRSRLLIPEGDRVVAEALIQNVFDSQGQADREKFAATFAEIQSADEPLTRFGAARRWRFVADIHDSEERSLERLTLVYDDWWRRWRIQEYDAILDHPTEFERTNPIRFAAVIYSMRDMEQLFKARNLLMATVYGTAAAAGVCGYYAEFETYPRALDMAYSRFMRKSLDKDPFHKEFDIFKYRLMSTSHAIDTLDGRINLKANSPVLYSRGVNNDDDMARDHRGDGSEGDIVFWPPIKAVLREQGDLP